MTGPASSRPVETSATVTAHALVPDAEVGPTPRSQMRAAQAALVSLEGNVDPLQSEALLKTLLRDAPNDAYLHFSLGNALAEQQRWPEAQQAYFDAYRLDESNADYAFNLAVSLDRLVQRRTALDYYRLALELAAERPATFDAASVNERIRIMTAAGEG